MVKPQIVLEKIVPRHCAALLRFELENAHYFSKFVPARSPEMLTEVGMSAAIDALELGMKSQEGLYFVALIGDEIVGRINFTIGGDQAELGYRVAEGWTGQGIAGQLVELGIKALAVDYKINRVIGRAMTSNPSSTRVLERAGFAPFNTEIGGGDRRGFSGDMVSFERWLD